MRPPRYRFPDQVRSTTRSIASRMVRDGSVAQTPEDLEAWIAERAEVRTALETGGYGTQFTAHDLLPLLHVFIGQEGGSVPTAAAAEAPSPPSSRRWWVGALILLVIAVLIFALAREVLPQT